jgi:hypothetical protein
LSTFPPQALEKRLSACEKGSQQPNGLGRLGLAVLFRAQHMDRCSFAGRFCARGADGVRSELSDCWRPLAWCAADVAEDSSLPQTASWLVYLRRDAMFRVTMFIGLVGVAGTVLAQATSNSNSQPYQPVVPNASSMNSYGGYYGGGGGGTVEGSWMQGMASVISAQGNYNLATSAAAVNLTQAEKQDIQNRQQATNAYFAMQQTNRAATAAKRSPRLSEEQLVRIAAQAAPKALDANDVNPVSGQVNWPSVLQDDMFNKDRVLVEQLLARQMSQGRLGIAEHEQLGDAIERMAATLKSQINSIPTQQYIAAKNFLKSLMYGATKAQLA